VELLSPCTGRGADPSGPTPVPSRPDATTLTRHRSREPRASVSAQKGEIAHRNWNSYSSRIRPSSVSYARNPLSSRRVEFQPDYPTSEIHYLFDVSPSTSFRLSFEARLSPGGRSAGRPEGGTVPSDEETRHVQGMAPVQATAPPRFCRVQWRQRPRVRRARPDARDRRRRRRR